MATIAFFGPRGTFTEQASRALDDNADLIPLPTIPDTIRALRAGDTQFACVPVENSVEGSVSATLDALADDEPVTAIREVVLPIAFSLLVRPGTDLRRVRTVASHPHALAQVRGWLGKHLPGAEQVPASSTAAAAVGVVNNEFDAAITAPVAADWYPLEVAARGIADRGDAATRFLLLTNHTTHASRTGADRTSIVLVAAHRPGELAAILEELSGRGINLTRIESRPLPGRFGEYRFYLDFDGHREEDRVREALASLRTRTKDLRFIGSFPRHDGARTYPGSTAATPPWAAAFVRRLD
ncbi:prephenate dehydratase [Lentzea sp. NPDC051213]|uniref:prephenate dehydratase n=1 Tax=Lentzea sp. NPDC051213 TaxID=3364126 RepID=UPI0037882A81